jgi:hypothetical protein
VYQPVALKGSIATLGSISFPAYQSRSIYQYQTSNWYSTGIGATILGYGNSNLEWQKTRTYDVGMDLGLFKDRIVISPRYYYKLTKGLSLILTLHHQQVSLPIKITWVICQTKDMSFTWWQTVFAYKDWNVNITR